MLPAQQAENKIFAFHFKAFLELMNNEDRK